MNTDKNTASMRRWPPNKIVSGLAESQPPEEILNHASSIPSERIF